MSKQTPLTDKKTKPKKVDKRLGNQFWKIRSKHGRDKLFKTTDKLWDAACEYFQWCDDNPLLEDKPFHYQGTVVSNLVPKMRAYTITALCLYLDCNVGYFNDFEKRLSNDDKDFSVVITRIRETIYSQKFTGAAADMLNPNIIARDLGLIDKKELEVNEVSITPEDRAKRIEELKAKINKE